jgi:hypothetical protein|tara:strand:+ start:652 stop:990 length:339 start_codon:yes stop_codon:yes gene_type:complete
MLICRKDSRTVRRRKELLRMHVDKLKTGPSSVGYRDNHKRIYGDVKKPSGLTAEESRKLRLERHKNDVRLGKKDAQYYVDHEVRTSADPNWQPKMENSKEYKDGWDRIFNKP